MKKTLLIGTLLIAIGSGCMKHPDMRMHNAVTLSDLASNVGYNGQIITIVEQEASSGCFPSGIVVARLGREVIMPDPKSNDKQPSQPQPTGPVLLSPLRPVEATYWVELFDGTPEIREVIAMHEFSVRHTRVTHEDLIRAARVLKGRLLLIFGHYNISKEPRCIVSGALYDVSTDTLVATVNVSVNLAQAEKRAETELDEHTQEPESDEDWSFYMDYLAHRDFEQAFKQCVWQLIDRDKRSRELMPNPFEDVKDYFPKGWHRRGRR